MQAAPIIYFTKFTENPMILKTLWLVKGGAWPGRPLLQSTNEYINPGPLLYYVITHLRKDSRMKSGY